MNQPLAGAVTLLFSDLAGTITLWDGHPEGYHLAMIRYDEVLRKCVEDRGGFLSQVDGSAFAGFPTASQALEAALATQLSLTAEALGLPAPLPARMALHTFSEEEGGTSFGPAAGFASRLLAAGHGGQTLLSQETQALVWDELPPLAALRDVGLMEDRGRPARVFQLLHPALPAVFPPLRPQGGPVLPHNLPQQATRKQATQLIGRNTSIEEVKALLAETRLLTLTGAGGIGKTRLALRVAADLLDGDSPWLDAGSDGVWLVELAALVDPAFLTGTVAQVLGVSEEAGEAVESTLAEALADKRLLLVLDGCEHLPAACAALAALLLGCPGVHILATCREPLPVAGEQTYQVPPLLLPDPKQVQTVQSVSPFGAVGLFTERTQAVQPSFTVTDQNAPAVAQICLRLDGIPLALELAAARVRSLTAQEINAGLDQRFRLLAGEALTRGAAPPQPPLRALMNWSRDLLAGGTRGTPSDTPSMTLPQSQIVRTVIEWSYDLLSETEQTFLSRLSVFAGGWIVTAAAGICDGEDIKTRGASREEQAALDQAVYARDQRALDLLADLVDCSLVVYEDGADDSEGRYHLPEPIRQYAGERLEESGEAEAVRARAASWFLGLAEMAASRLDGPEQAKWLAVFEAERNNLRASLAWKEQWASSGQEGVRPEPDARRENGAYLANALWRFWRTQGYLSEGRRWLGGVLGNTTPGTVERDGTPTEEASPGRARALFQASLLARDQGDYAAARALQEESLALVQQLGDQQAAATGLTNLGNIAWAQGDFITARPFYEQSLTLVRRQGGVREVANSVSNLANATFHGGDAAAARPLYEEALALYRQLEDPREIASMLNLLGNIAHNRKDYAAARAAHEEALTLYRQWESTEWIANTLFILGNIAEDQKDYAAARALYEECLTLQRQLGNEQSTSDVLNKLASLADAGGDLTETRALRREEGSPPQQSGDAEDTAVSLSSRGQIAFSQGDLAAARPLYEEAQALYRQRNDSRGIASVLSRLGDVALHQKDYAAARPLYEECLTLRRQLGSQPEVAASLVALGYVAQCQKDNAAARTFYKEALRFYRQSDNDKGAAVVLGNLGSLAYYEEDDTAARTWYEESLAVLRQLGDREGIAGTLGNLANAASSQGDLAAARSWYEEALALYQQSGDQRRAAVMLDSLGKTAFHQNDFAAARAFYEEGLTVYQQLGDQQGIAKMQQRIAKFR